MAPYSPQGPLASERIAAIAFGIYVAAALPILIILGSHYWFAGDEWVFLVGGDITDPAALFRPINAQHWMTLPILVYRGLYSVFGLHSYLPFQLYLIVLHLTLCILLRVIMRRAGVGPWTATISAGAFVLFGSGEVNILAGVQIGQVGSMVLACFHLILADHDGRVDRRDWLGLLCGLMSIMSSALGPPLVAIVGLAVICRRGWRLMLFHTLPLAMAYVVWWISNFSEFRVEQTFPSVSYFLLWVIHGETGMFLALGGNTFVATVLGILLVTGLILAWTPLSLSTLRKQASLPAAMLIGAFALQVVICTQRGQSGLDAARADRYISLYTVFTLPALAVAVDAVVRRWRVMMPIACTLFLVGIRANISQFGTDIFQLPALFDSTRATLLAVAYSPLAEQAPADLRPEPNFMTGGSVDMAFLLEARNSGRLPPPPEMTAALESQTELRLSVQQLSGPIPGSRTCAMYAESIDLHPEVGDIYEFTTPIRISLGRSGTPLTYNSIWASSRAIRILRPDLHLHLTPRPKATSFGLCN